MGVIEFLTEMAYRKDRGKWELDRQKQAAAKMKTGRH